MNQNPTYEKGYRNVLCPVWIVGLKRRKIGEKTSVCLRGSMIPIIRFPPRFIKRSGSIHYNLN
jgi:hypothetical protein